MYSYARVLQLLDQASMWVNTPPAVPCGFPSPAEDFAFDRIDLAAILANTTDTFVMRASGLSMSGAGINPGDLLLVRRNAKPEDGSIIIAVVDGEFTCKFVRLLGQFRLESANPEFPPIIPKEGQEVRLWGVVKHVIRAV